MPFIFTGWPDPLAGKNKNKNTPQSLIFHRGDGVPGNAVFVKQNSHPYAQTMQFLSWQTTESMTKCLLLCSGDILLMLGECLCAGLEEKESSWFNYQAGQPCTVSVGVSALKCWFQHHSDYLVLILRFFLASQSIIFASAGVNFALLPHPFRLYNTL